MTNVVVRMARVRASKNALYVPDSLAVRLVRVLQITYLNSSSYLLVVKNAAGRTGSSGPAAVVLGGWGTL